MTSIVALILCTTFVVYLLKLERSNNPGVSIVLWIPTIWMLLIASKPLGTWFQLKDMTIESGSVLDRRFLVVLLCLGFYILTRRRLDWFSVIKQNVWLMLLITYMLFSIFWSEIPYISFKRWIRDFIPLIMALLLLTESSPREAFESLCRRTIYILIPFSLLLIKYFPEYGRTYGRWSGGEMWIGVTMQKNGLGRLCLISGFFLVWSLIRRRQGQSTRAGKYQNYADIFVLGITAWLIKGPNQQAYSATAVASLLVGLAVYAWLLKIKKHGNNLSSPPFTIIIASIIILGIITVFVGGSTIKDLTSSLGRDATLTGRTAIWAELLPIAMEKPVVGYGFGGFWTSTTREIYKVSEGHNGYLDVLLNLGFIGLLLIFMFLMSFCRKAQKELVTDFDWASLMICFLVMAVVHNIAESSIQTFSTHLTAILVFLSISSTVFTPIIPEVHEHTLHPVS